jgi:hypothetical protein
MCIVLTCCSDVLRDHYGRCDARKDSPIPKQEERGRKRHACEACSRLKIKCDGSETPCKKCREFGRECIRSGKRAKRSESEEQNPDLSMTDRNSISFLLNDVGNVNFAQCFPESAVSESSSRASVGGNEDAFGGAFGGTMGGPSFQMLNPPQFFGANGNVDAFLEGLGFAAFERTSNWQFHTLDMGEQMRPQTQQKDWTALTARALEMQNALRQALDDIARVNTMANYKPVVQAIDSITGQKVDSYVKLYFRHWHKHGSIIHEPTFDSSTVALPLLMAVFTIGSMYEKKPDAAAAAKLLMDYIEHWIYTNGIIGDKYDIQQPTDLIQDERISLTVKLQQLQGAYLIVNSSFMGSNSG